MPPPLHSDQTLLLRGREVTMQLGLCVLVAFLSSAALTGSGISSSQIPQGKRQRRISSSAVGRGCARGCDLCSESNGCVKCSPRLFILLERNDIRQTGVCLPSCPLGYFDVRNPAVNKCTKCKIDNCEACFSRNFCTKCTEGLYLHKGKCQVACPQGSLVARDERECSGPALCEMSEWSSWGPCSKKRRLCGFRRGHQGRSRHILQAPSGDASLCPATTELRSCLVQRTPCPEGWKKKRGERGKGVPTEKNRNQKDAKGSRAGIKGRKGFSQETVVLPVNPV